jgi:hypothetical protein
MRILLLIILFSCSVKSVAQEKEPQTGPPEDPEYQFTLIVRPGSDNYEYRFKTATDTLEIKKWIDKTPRVVKIKVKKNLRKYFLNEVLTASENLKVDSLHKPFRSGSSVSLLVRYNFGMKVFNLLDPFYIEQLVPMLEGLNERLAEEDRFPMSFKKEEQKSSMDKDTIISVEIDHALGLTDKKDRRLVCKPGKWPAGEVDYFDTIAKIKKSKQPIVLRPAQVKGVKSRTIQYVNGFTLKDEKFTRTNLVLQNFVITYAVPGFFMGVEINSLEKAKQNKKAADYLQFLNSCLENKHRFY